MTFEGAIVKEQNVTFAVVVVKQHVVDNRGPKGRPSPLQGCSEGKVKQRRRARRGSSVP